MLYFLAVILPDCHIENHTWFGDWVRGGRRQAVVTNHVEDAGVFSQGWASASGEKQYFEYVFRVETVEFCGILYQSSKKVIKDETFALRN